MRLVNNLEEALEITRAGIFTAKQNEAHSRIQRPPLFLPRKKLKMQRVYSGEWQPWSWFIQERLEERARELTQPTECSLEGLTSGFRSALIKNPDGTYTKLKGVSLKPIIKYSKKDALTKNRVLLHAKGLGVLSEAYNEMENLQIINCMDGFITSCIPQFIEIYKFPSNKIEKETFLSELKTMPLRISCPTINPGEWQKLRAELESANRKLGEWPARRSYDYFVIGMRIESDTRLDEIVFQLTKKEIRGGLREKRDEILRYLFFRAGVLNGTLVSSGFTWSSDLVYSNSHFGNFVVQSRKDNIDVRICDLGTAQFFSRFANACQFMRFANAEVDNFQYEFERTSSLTTQRSYLHFPKKLKGECLDALKTGYAMILYEETKKGGNLFEYKSSRQIIPESAVLPTEEFEEILKEIA